MRIALIGPANPDRGGIAKFQDTLAANMHRLGHEVFVVNFSLQYPSFLFPGKTQYTDAEAVPYRSERILSSVSPLSWFRTARAIKEFKPDIAVFRYWTPFMAPCLGTVAALTGGIPRIAVTDNILPHERHFFDKPFTRYFLKRTDKVVYMSRKVGEELALLGYSGKSAYHPHPVYDSYGEKRSREEACAGLSLDPKFKYAMFFGFIREYKGLDTLLRAWAMVKAPDVRLIVAGEFYSDPAPYLNLAEKLGDRVIMRTEYIPEKDVSFYFSAADLVVQPYRTASQSGITGIAYNYGVPMVVTDVGGLKESVTDSVEGYVTETDEKSLAEAIEKYFAGNRKDEFSANMKKRAGEFTWKGMTECIVGN